MSWQDVRSWYEDNDPDEPKMRPTHYLCLDGWAGYREVPVELIETIGKHARVKLLGRAMIPRQGEHMAGDEVRVPISALKAIDASKESGREES